jgi:hypothetical protein
VIATVVKRLDRRGLLRLPRPRRLIGLAVTPKWWIGEHQLREVQPGRGCVQGERGAGRVPVHEHRLACLGEQRGDVIDLALDGVGPGVLGLSAATSVEVVDGELPGELTCRWDVEAEISQRAPDDDQRGSGAAVLVRDGCSVFGSDLVHSTAFP